MKFRMFRPGLTALILSALLTVTACSSSTAVPNVTSEPTRSTEIPPITITATVQKPSATPIKIIIYTDFDCGACEKLHSVVEPEMRARYVATGKAQIEIRPLGALGPASMRAAEAALSAADQGYSLEYQSALFEAWRQDGSDAYATERLISLAGSLGMDTAAFARDMSSEAKKTELENNMSLAQRDGVHTLPAVLIGSVKVEGYHPLNVYADIMNQSVEGH